jgi:hypothetical protein
MKSLFFNKKNVSANGKISFVFTDRPSVVTESTKTIKITNPETGEVTERTIGIKSANGDGPLTYGVFYVRDTETKDVVHDENHEEIQFFSSLPKNTEVEGMTFSEEFIIDQRTNEPTSLKWVRTT